MKQPRWISREFCWEEKKKAISNGDILWDYVYIIFLKECSYRCGKQISSYWSSEFEGCRSERVEVSGSDRRHKDCLQEPMVTKQFYIFVMVVVTQNYTCDKNLLGLSAHREMSVYMTGEISINWWNLKINVIFVGLILYSN